MERAENYLEHNEKKLEIYFSIEDEIRRIEHTLGEYEWYKANNYPLTLPKNINTETLLTTNTDIESAAKEDFDTSVYEQKAEEIRKCWEEMSKRFFEKAESFNLPIQSEYSLYLTRYGVGGSYRLPNTVILNFNYPNYEKIESVMMIIFHEIVHLSMEEWIKEYKIPHWTKERLVDLTYNMIFEEKANLQRDPENSERVEQIFNSYFPDMKRVIVELSNQEQ